MKNNRLLVNAPISIGAMRILGLLLALVPHVAQTKEPEPTGWSQYKGKGYALCDGLLKELRRYKYSDPFKNPNACSRAVIANYPGVTEPPWQDLDVKQHEELLFQLRRFAAIGAKNYFDPGQDKTDYKSLPDITGKTENALRRQVQDFITGGGQIRVWRTPLFKSYDILEKNPLTRGPLNILQLRMPIGNSKLHGMAPCPRPRLEWLDNTMLVNEHLTGPDPRLDPKIDSWGLRELTGNLFLKFKDVPHRFSVGSWDASIYRDGFPADDGSGEFCRLEYRKPNPERK